MAESWRMGMVACAAAAWACGDAEQGRVGETATAELDVQADVPGDVGLDGAATTSAPDGEAGDADIAHDAPDGDARTTPSGRTFGPLDVVTGASFERLLIEIDVVEGAAPHPDVIARVEAELDALIASGHLGKPGGVRIVFDDTLPASASDGARSFASLDGAAGAHRSIEPAADEASIYVLYADGAYEGDEGASRVLGFAYGGSVMVMLRDNVDWSCDQAGGGVGGIVGVSDEVCRRAEAYVFIHELGHLFGLVNNGLEMQSDHQDPDHGAHDVDEGCIMYWQVERSGAIEMVADSLLGGGDDTAGELFDPACLADMAAAQGE